MNDLWYTRRFMGMIAAPARTRVLRAGIHAGLFEAMREPRQPEDLARSLELEPDLVESWCRAAVASGLVRERHGRYATSGFVRWMLDSPLSASFFAVLDQAVETTSPILDRLPGLMRGAPRPSFGTPAEARRAAAGSRLVERRALETLGRVPGVRDARRVLDIGCGYGTYLAGLLQHYRDAQGVGVEKEPDLAEEARRRLDAAGLTRRGEIVVGDFREIELEGSFDLALLNNNLYYFPPATHPALFERVAELLAPRGVLAIQIPVAVTHAAVRLAGMAEIATVFDLFLRSHTNLHGLPDLADLHRTLRQVGFSDVGEAAILPGGTSRYVWARVRA